MGVASFLMLGFILHFPTRVSTRSQSHSPLHTVSSLPSRPSSGIAALAVCAALFGSVRAQSVTLNSISIEGLDSQEGTIAYGEEGFVKISVEGYKGNELSAYQDQDKVHIVLSQKNDDDNWVDLTACRVFATKFQDCECDGDVEKLKITSFPLCVQPGQYKLKLELKYLDTTLADAVYSDAFTVVLSDADCKPGYANEDTGNKEPGCKPCEVGTYRGEDDDSCISCDDGLTTYDRGSTKASTCEALENPAKKFVAFASSFFMLSNAGGLSLEDHEDATPEECIVKCAQDPGCKAFDAGNDGRVPRASTFQRGDCFLSYDTEATIKERDVREVSQLILYRKIDAQEQRKVFFRRTVDGFIKGNDAGGVFRNEHSPDACAQLCLDDINCVSFDAGRQYALKWDGADVSRGKEWQPHIDNCYLSYTTKDAVTKDRWEQPNCDKQTNPNPPFDPDCSNDDANGIDYYERIIPMFVEFDVEWSKLVNPQYFTWGKVNEFGEKKTFYTPLMNRPATTDDDGDGYGGGYYNYDDDGYSNDGAPGGGDDGAPGGGDDGGGDDDDDADYDGDAPDDYFTALFYDDPRQYRSESRPPRKDLKATILERYPHVGTRDAMAKQVVAWVMEAVKANGGDTDVEMACNIEVGKNGKTIAQINTGSDKNDGILKYNLASISFSCPEGWDACTYDDSSAVDAKIISAADMKCAAGTASTSGFGQGDSCVPCGLDRYPNGPQTDCRLCPQGTTTKVGARVKGALAKEGERQCIVAPDQSQAKLGSFRVGYEWHGTFASPLGAAGNGRWAQGDYKMRVTSATVNEDNKIVMEVFVEARHGEDCDRSRAFGNACICEGGARCACYTDPNGDGDLSDAVENPLVIAGNQCSNSDCSCRDPGLTSYYLSGTADSTTIDLMRVSKFSGITDRNDWLFVARGFKGKISIEKGNIVINGLFATPTEQPGNSVGPPLIPKLNVDRTSDYKKCDEAKFDHCGKTGYVKLTERCYAAVEVGTFNVGDTFVGSQQCYRPGTNMRVTGLNKRPEENVRKMDVAVTNVETSDDDDALVTVTAEITVTFGVDGNPEDQGEGRYLASGEYNPTTGGIELIPNAAAWLTSHPRNIPARMIKGGLTQEGELVVGTILPNPKCECKDICDGRGDEPKCRVGKDCAEGQQNTFGDDDDDTNYYAPCDEATAFGEEAKGFYEDCTSFNLARVCQAPTPVCEIGWTLIDESERCYKFMDDKMTYADAKDACEEVDSQLASIHGQAENTKVGDMAKSFDLKDDDFFWIGLTVKSKLPAWIDGTPFTYTGHTRERTLRPKGPCGAYKIGGSNLWQTDQIPDSDGSCDDTTLPFVCKKPPAGQLSPCSCSGVSDEDHFGGSCKSWTPGEKAWSTPWCYVAKNCERAVKQKNGRFKATCVDPNAAPKTTTAAVSTKFSGDAQCDAGKFQKDADTCVDCKTCSDGKVPSSNFGDRCGAINPKNQKPQPAFKDHDFTCCTPYFTKVAECAKDSKGASPSTSCRGGKDFTCQECPAGTYYPVRQDCQNAAFVAKNSKVCRCLPCDVVCATCSNYPGQCTSCSDNLYLKKTARSSTCTSVCDGRADAGAKRLFYAATETASCEKCTTAENCPKTTISAKCSATADTRFEGECSTSTMTSTTTVTTKTATQTTVLKMGCITHLQCSFSQYCDSNNDCFRCSSCAQYKDALAGLVDCQTRCATTTSTATTATETTRTDSTLTATTSTATVTSQTYTTPHDLPVNSECDPRKDQCDSSADLVCDPTEYKCRYTTDSTSVKPSATTRTRTQTRTTVLTNTATTKTRTTRTRTTAITNTATTKTRTTRTRTTATKTSTTITTTTKTTVFTNESSAEHSAEIGPHNTASGLAALPKTTLYLMVSGIVIGVLLVFGIGSFVGRKRTERRLQKGYAHVQQNGAYELEREARIKGFGKNTFVGGTNAARDDDDDELLGGSDDEDDALVGRSTRQLNSGVNA